MEHTRTVKREFTRQAEAFAQSPDLRAPEVTLRIARALEDSKAARVLDVACGPGVLTPALCEVAPEVIGLDLTRKTLQLARDACATSSNAAFVQGLAERSPFGDGCFDAAVIRLALHHTERPARVLAELRRLLRAGGRLVILDILTSQDNAIAELHNALERLRDPSHTTFLSKEQLRGEILRAGFALRSENSWRADRDFAGWARIITEPRRMESLEVVLRHLERAGVETGLDLSERSGQLWLTYEWGEFVAEAE